MPTFEWQCVLCFCTYSVPGVWSPDNERAAEAVHLRDDCSATSAGPAGDPFDVDDLGRADA